MGEEHNGIGPPLGSSGASTTAPNPGEIGPLPLGAGYQMTVSSVRGVPGMKAESLVHEMVRTPAANDPSLRGSKQVPAVQVTTSAHEVSSVHAVRSMRRESLQLEGRESLHDGVTAPALDTPPQATLAPPHDDPRMVVLAVSTHGARSAPALIASCRV